MRIGLAEPRMFKYLVCVLVLLIVADGLVSQYVVAEGLGSEGNPFLRGLIGETEFFAVKVVGALLTGLILWDIFRRRARVAALATLVCVILYTGVVYWNLGVLLAAGSL